MLHTAPKCRLNCTVSPCLETALLYKLCFWNCPVQTRDTKKLDCWKLRGNWGVGVERSAATREHTLGCDTLSPAHVILSILIETEELHL
jgi:hypothetical protein